jgi:hypothetical protein
MNKTIPWWAQLGLAVLAIAGTVAVEYFQERLINANSSKDGNDEQASYKQAPKRKYSK